MTLRFLLCLTLGLLLGSGCGRRAARGGDPAIHTYWINSARVPCTGASEQSCYEVKRDRDLEEGDWSYFYDDIAGFDYQPGFLYRLRVREVPLTAGEVPADASTIRYELVEVLEQRTDPSLSLNDVWALESIGEQAIRYAEAAARLDRPTLELQLAEDRVVGSDGCNRFTGRIEAAGASELVLGALASTKRACLDDGGIPAMITDALARTTRYRIDGLRLILLGAGGEQLLTYRKVD